jgi:hypothetical protein
MTSTGVFAALDATGVGGPGGGRPPGPAQHGGSRTTAHGGEAPAAPPTWNEAVMFKDSPNVKAGIGVGVRAQFTVAREAALASMEIQAGPAQPTPPGGPAGGNTVPAATMPQ